MKFMVHQLKVKVKDKKVLRKVVKRMIKDRKQKINQNCL
jgi:hypothetical protein